MGEMVFVRYVPATSWAFTSNVAAFPTVKTLFSRRALRFDVARATTIKALPLGFSWTIMILFDDMVFAPSTLDVRLAKMLLFDFDVVLTMTHLECRWNLRF